VTVADAPVAIVWLDPEPPDAAQARALAAWAHAHGVLLRPPDDVKPRAIPVDSGRADDVERLLDRARDAIAARDADATDRALADAESALSDHPELPQAAWLLAEVERARSTRYRRIPPVDEEAADRAWARAEGLDGGRVPGAGEALSIAHPAQATIALSVEPAGATPWLDGRRVATGNVVTAAGRHALVVTWGDVVVWAGWIETPAGTSAIHFAVPASPPCSAGDVAHARVEAGAGPTRVDADAVRCGAWVAALHGRTTDEIAVTSCEGGHCGALSAWRAPIAWTWTPPPDHGGSQWPTWATWGLVGAGAAVVTGIVLVTSGAFQSAPTQTRFVSSGLRTQAE
jgi:hypothetical protein